MKLGALLEFALIGFNVATAVVIYPLVRRQSETVSLGYVAARIMESTFIAIGLMSIISVVNVMDRLPHVGGAQATALVVEGRSLVHTYEWAFLFGPGLVVGLGDGLMLAYLMYRSGLVPRGMAMLGLIGGPLLILSFVLQLFDVYENGSGPDPSRTPRGLVGGVARHLCSMEGLPYVQPTRQTGNGDGPLNRAHVQLQLATSSAVGTAPPLACSSGPATRRLRILGCHGNRSCAPSEQCR